MAIFVLIFLLMSVGFYWIFHSLDLAFAVIFGVVPIIIGIVVFINAIREIKFGSDGLQVSSLTSNKKYSVEQIEKINLVVKRNRNANHNYIHIINTSGKTEKVSLFGHVPIILYHQLKSWFDNAKK